MNILKNILLKVLPIILLIAIVHMAIKIDNSTYTPSGNEDSTADSTANSESDTESDTAEATDSTDADTEETTADTTTEDTTSDTEDTPVEDTTSSTADDTSDTSENIPSDPQSFFSSLDSTEVLLSVGYGISDKPYGENLRLSLLNRSIGENKASLRNITELIPIRVPNETGTTYSTEFKESEKELSLVSIYMDYILVDNGKTFTVYDKSGKPLIENFDTEEYSLAYTRDKKGNPLFVKEETSLDFPEIPAQKYYYIDESGNLAESDYNDKSDSRGLYINFPADFGTSSNHLNVVYSDDVNLYGYMDSNGVMVSEYIYKNAYNFSDGLTGIVDALGVLNYTDSGIYRTIFSNGWYYNDNDQRVRPLLVEPDSRGIESLGFFYFENGLCRARLQTVDAYLWETYRTKEIRSDRDIILRADGSEFQTPEGYRVVSYSNGMILLEKDGLYGYMDHNGQWAIEPIYTYAEPFSEGLAVVGSNGKLGIIDKDGTFLIPMIFDRISTPSGGIIAVYEKEHGWAIINKCIYPAA